MHEESQLNEKALPLTMTGLAIVMAAISGGAFFMAKGAMDKASALETQFEAKALKIEHLLARMDELDAGMVAMAKVSKIDGAELRRVMAMELSEMRNGVGTPDAVVPAQVEEAVSVSEQQAPAVQILAPVLGLANTQGQPSVPPAPSASPPGPTKAPAQNQDFEAIVKDLQQTDPTRGVAVSPPPTDIQAKPSLTMADVDGILVKRISEQWHKPAGVTDGMTVEIHIKMSRDGKLNKVDIRRSSGLDVFDRSAILALKNIGVVKEVAQLDDATYDKAYRSRTIVFSPELMGG